MAVAAAAGKKKPPARVAIAGGGICGAVLGGLLAGLVEEGALEVVVYEAREQDARPPGLNLLLNANGVAAVRAADPGLAARLDAVGLGVRKWEARTMTGEELYVIPDAQVAGLADGAGLRCRWDDVQRACRVDAENLNLLRWGTKVVGYRVTSEGLAVHLEDVATGRTWEEEHDLLVATDGRYSAVRTQLEGGAPPEAHVMDIADFRLLVPDTTGGLIDDLTRVYNVPDISTLADRFPHLTAAAGDDAAVFEQECMRGLARVGVMRIPEVAGRVGEGDIIGIFGNVRIPHGGRVPESAKTQDGMRALFTPVGGEEVLDPIGRFILDALVENAERLHWERFQEIGARVVDWDGGEGRVLLLGDAAHAFCPSLGQGANMALEDACAAGAIIQRAMELAGDDELDVFSVSKAVEAVRLPRVETVGAMSSYHAAHLARTDALAAEVEDWTADTGWQGALTYLWSGWPRPAKAAAAFAFLAPAPPGAEAEAAAVNAEVEAASQGTPFAWEISPEERRAQRRAQYVPELRREDHVLPTEYSNVPVALFRPASGVVRGILVHVHGGCFVFGDADGQDDSRLQNIADDHEIAVCSVGYRLCPEHTHADAVADVAAALRWASSDDGAQVLHASPEAAVLANGESAGANLLVCATVALRDASALPARLRALSLSYGWFDLSLSSPSVDTWGERRLVMTAAEYAHYAALTCPDEETRAKAEVSPIEADLAGLPPAYFSVGTADALLDDTRTMYSRWREAGNEAILREWPNASHGVGCFGPHADTRIGRYSRDATAYFLVSYIGPSQPESPFGVYHGHPDVEDVNS